MSKKTTAKDPKPTAERIEQLANRVLLGDIILPEFQRPFVWKRKQILELLDSIYRNYPIGSALLWESRQELASKRSIADLEVGERSKNYPVNYLLDGQQRLSTICGVLHWEPGDPKSVWNVIFDLKTEKFSHIDHAEALPAHQIPIRRLSDPADYFRKISVIDDTDLRSVADLLFNRFKDYQLPLVTLGDMSINDVAPVFERINSTGTRLTIYDLMRAATWSPDFDLGKTIESIKTSLEEKKFHSFENKTFLRCLGAASGSDFSSGSIDSLRHLDPDTLHKCAEQIKSASQLAVDFLSTEIKAPRAEALPYANQFAVLVEFFRVLPHPSSNQLDELKRWFWLTTLSGYFSGWDSGQMATDAKSIREFADGKAACIDVSASVPNSSLWNIKPFRTNSAISKMIALMFATKTPLDLLTGQVIDIDKSLAWSNDKEFHHLFPQGYLSKNGVKSSKGNVPGNIILLTSKSNISISDTAPSVYLKQIIDSDGRDTLVERLESNLVPECTLEAALNDDFGTFLNLRATYLHGIAESLSRVNSNRLIEVSPKEMDDSDIDPTE
jgi:hypothetical protein